MIPQNGNFGRIALTKKKFNEIGGYDQSLLPMGYQDWDIIKRRSNGCKYVNPTDSDFNRAIMNEGGKDLSMANQTDEHKKMGWVEMNRINKLKCHHNLYKNKHQQMKVITEFVQMYAEFINKSNIYLCG